jgi:hypothetical protein
MLVNAPESASLYQAMIGSKEVNGKRMVSLVSLQANRCQGEVDLVTV